MFALHTVVLLCLVSFVLGGLLWTWVLSQVEKFKRKNN